MAGAPVAAAATVSDLVLPVVAVVVRPAELVATLVVVAVVTAVTRSLAPLSAIMSVRVALVASSTRVLLIVVLRLSSVWIVLLYLPVLQPTAGADDDVVVPWRLIYRRIL